MLAPRGPLVPAATALLPVVLAVVFLLVFLRFEAATRAGDRR